MLASFVRGGGHAEALGLNNRYCPTSDRAQRDHFGLLIAESQALWQAFRCGPSPIHLLHLVRTTAICSSGLLHTCQPCVLHAVTVLRSPRSCSRSCPKAAARRRCYDDADLPYAVAPAIAGVLWLSVPASPRRSGARAAMARRRRESVAQRGHAMTGDLDAMEAISYNFSSSLQGVKAIRKHNEPRDRRPRPFRAEDLVFRLVPTLFSCCGQIVYASSHLRPRSLTAAGLRARKRWSKRSIRTVA